jgi:glycosyltransferase involved in cell wall biosynthesis
MPALSVIIITKNEAHRIRRCLESVQWADEIVVVDSGSSDDTRSICRKFTDKVVVRSFDNFSNQKNAALNQASGEWVLSIDADEVVTADLAREIREQIGNDGAGYAAYSVRRENYICGRPIRHVFQNDWQVKLLKRGACRYFKSVHEDLDVKGAIGKLETPLLHYNSDSLREFIRKQDQYTTLEAKEKFGRGERFSFVKLVFSPPRTFVFRYLTIGGYKDGWMGFVIAAVLAYYVFQIHRKMLALTKSDEM